MKQKQNGCFADEFQIIPLFGHLQKIKLLLQFILINDIIFRHSAKASFYVYERR